MSDNSAPPAGWYKRKNAPDLEGYWDGKSWTEHTRPIKVATSNSTPQRADGPSIMATMETLETPVDLNSEISKLEQLRYSGVLSDEEFLSARGRVLQKYGAANVSSQTNVVNNYHGATAHLAPAFYLQPIREKKTPGTKRIVWGWVLLSIGFFVIMSMGLISMAPRASTEQSASAMSGMAMGVAPYLLTGGLLLFFGTQAKRTSSRD